MKANDATQSETALQNRKSGGEVAEKKTKQRLSRTHQDYWKGRLFHEAYTRDDGSRAKSPDWSVRLQYLRERFTFHLNTSNREAAAVKARDIYRSLLANGWEPTLAVYAPQVPLRNAKAGGEPTVGEFLEEVERVAGLKPRTFHRYAQCFRMIAAFVGEVADTKQKFDYVNGGLAAYRAKTDAVTLKEITPAAVSDWKRAYLARAGDDPQRQVPVRRAFNAALRNAKSLFNPRVIRAPNFRIQVPLFKVSDPQRGEREVLWFEEIRFEKPGSMKFQAPHGITFKTLLVAAQSELRTPPASDAVEMRTTKQQAYLLFLLCLCAGLRRGEADTLLWAQINTEDNTIVIEPSLYHQPKHESGGRVAVERALIRELLRFKRMVASQKVSGPFVVSSPLKWKATRHYRYRCDPHWKTLNQWLGGKGITARKKVHELRKLFGDALCKERGIYAASAQLRHASIQMTANHYVDPQQRAALPVTDILKIKRVRPATRKTQAS